MTIHKAARPARSTPSAGRVPFALVTLVLVPAIAGSLRLVELAGGPHAMPANPRITASPVPVVVHRAWMTRAYALAVEEYVICRHGILRTISRPTIKATAKAGFS